ncbi:hypothetical protein F4778DRAFT_715123 [Xylariomycetidae sp. FL2044]|nr:hypothetical protein F4778DRAFT_715123 [Xylariomycetidae sp. FL2044]
MAPSSHRSSSGGKDLSSPPPSSFSGPKTSDSIWEDLGASTGFEDIVNPEVTAKDRWPPIEGDGSREPDMTTWLLVLSCYTSLGGVYCVVFDHFEAYLRSLPQHAWSATDTLPVDLTPRPDLLLGEIPCGDETCSRIYRAVHMLIDAYRVVENLLGLPETMTTLGLLRKSHCWPDHEARFRPESPRLELPANLIRSVLWGDMDTEGTGEWKGVGGIITKIEAVQAVLYDKMTVSFEDLSIT